MYYSAIGILSIIIHLILNHEYLRNREEKTEVNLALKMYIWAALIYYITDAAWGLIYETHIPIAIYIDTVLYYLAMALTVVLLCRYVTTYLRLHNRFGRFINLFGLIFGIAEVVILVINHFVQIFFWIDQNAVYHAYTLRYVALYMQVLLCLLLAIQTGYVMTRAIGEKKKRCLTIFLFCVEMGVAIIAQIVYPLLPLYSVGLVLGSIIIHTFVNESEKEEQYKVMRSMADVFYSMHVIDLENDIVEEFSAAGEVKAIVNDRHGAVQMMEQVMRTVIVDEYLDRVLEFVDLTTLADRMQNKKSISSQFIGKNTGWFLAMFIAIETDADDRPTKVIFTTRVIEEEKKQEEKLRQESQTDELTGLFNRRAYENHITDMGSIPDDFVYIAMDVNGLKVTNDTIGHEAGDELIVGSTECMKKAFGPYGRLYRTGGDEFVAMLNVSEDDLGAVLEAFEDAMAAWTGKYIDSISVSYGYVTRQEYKHYTIHRFEIEADKRMYVAKNAYYQKKGIDRRGQQDAHRLLCETYTKILRINLTDDTYQIINILEDEKIASKGFSDQISVWLHDFGMSGQVHPDDLAEYLERTDRTFMQNYFKEDNSTLLILYRRKYGDEYKRVMMEMIRANDYSDENQSLFLYVKNIEN